MDSNIYIEFGRRLATLRNSKNLSQNDIAKKLGIAQTTYSGYENGVRKIPLEFITALSDILDVSPTFLINGTQPKKYLLNAESDFNLDNREKNTIKKYRSLNENGKDRTDMYLDDLLDNPKYINHEPNFDFVKQKAEQLSEFAQHLTPIKTDIQK